MELSLRRLYPQRDGNRRTIAGERNVLAIRKIEYFLLVAVLVKNNVDTLRYFSDQSGMNLNGYLAVNPWP
jgi:hypothetical protein